MSHPTPQITSSLTSVIIVRFCLLLELDVEEIISYVPICIGMFRSLLQMMTTGAMVRAWSWQHSTGMRDFTPVNVLDHKGQLCYFHFGAIMRNDSKNVPVPLF